ncbi:MAG: hypothetical protein ACE5LU_21545, partial [Anaerolineae bacterium]
MANIQRGLSSNMIPHRQKPVKSKPARLRAFPKFVEMSLRVKRSNLQAALGTASSQKTLLAVT